MNELFKKNPILYERIRNAWRRMEVVQYKHKNFIDFPYLLIVLCLFKVHKRSLYHEKDGKPKKMPE